MSEWTPFWNGIGGLLNARGEDMDEGRPFTFTSEEGERLCGQGSELCSVLDIYRHPEATVQKGLIGRYACFPRLR